MDEAPHPKRIVSPEKETPKDEPHFDPPDSFEGAIFNLTQNVKDSSSPALLEEYLLLGESMHFE